MGKCGLTLCAAIATICCLVAVSRGARARSTWLFFACGCATWLCGQMVWNYYQLVAHAAPPFPSLGDAGWLGFVLWFVVGVLTLPRLSSGPGLGRFFFSLDFLIIGATLSLIGDMLGRTLLINSIIVDNLGKSVAMAYPVGYLTLGLIVFLLILRVPDLAAAPGMPLLLLGLLCEAAGFIAWVPRALHGTFRTGTPLDLVWMAGMLAIGLAGLAWRSPDRPRAAKDGQAPPAPSLAPVVLGLAPTILGTGIALLALFLEQVRCVCRWRSAPVC